jgi:hypothetical protein
VGGGGAPTRSLPSPRYWHSTSITPQRPRGPAFSPSSLVDPLYKHYGAMQYSASSTLLLDVRPPGRNQDKPCVTSCLAPAMERLISTLLLVSVGTTFRTDNYIIIKWLFHDVPTWFKKRATRPAIYSTGVSFRLVPIPQLTCHPYPQHCYHVEREVFVHFWVC